MEYINYRPQSEGVYPGRKQFQVSQALLGGFGVQRHEKPFFPLSDKKRDRSTEAEPAPFLGNGQYANDRDKEPPPACDW